jgi:hypothetical protein
MLLLLSGNMVMLIIMRLRGSSYKTYSDYKSFNYVLLCRFGNYYITCGLPNDGEIGFDPNYDKKFHYPKYGTNEYYLVS